MLNLTKTALDGVLLLEPTTNFEDYRGSYVEIYNERHYHEAGLTQHFIQDDISVSSRRVLRGIHGDDRTWKLVSCLHGSFYLVVVNNDPSSAEYRKWTAFTLSSTNKKQVLIPPRFGNGHLVMSDQAIFHYKQTTEYSRESQFTICWDDPGLKIWWPVKDPILSIRDSSDGFS